MTTFGCLRKGHAVIDSRTIVIASLSDEPRLLKLRSFLYSPGDPRSDIKDRPITGVAGRRPTMSFNASAYKELNSGNSEVFVPARLCSGRGLNQSFRYPFRLTDHPGGFNLFRAKYNTRNEVTDTLDPLRW